jgi:hypothetical protein
VASSGRIMAKTVRDHERTRERGVNIYPARYGKENARFCRRQAPLLT